MNQTAHTRAWGWIWNLSLVAVMALGLYLRGTGLFRGLDEGFVFHPDAPKQVAALSNYLRGEYYWRTGSWFYDGYPYFLNHVDEWIIRVAQPLVSRIRAWWVPDSMPRGASDLNTLFYWAHTLRLLYGFSVMLLTWSAARRLLRDRLFVLVALLLLALAPISIAVTHSATGDIGVDLFLAVALAVLCRYVRSPSGWLLAGAGLSCGLAFAAKYHGALGLALIGLFVVADARWILGKPAAPGHKSRKLDLHGHPLRRRWLTAARRLTLAGAGWLAGAVAGTPALFINAKQTWADMLVNFQRIRDYGADSALLGQPFHTRAWFGLTTNLLPTLRWLGFGVCLLAALAVVAWFLPSSRVRQPSRDDHHERRTEALLLAVAVFPFVFLFLSLILKPAVQPFHFSSLQVPLSIAAAAGLQWLAGARESAQPRWRQILALAGAVVLSAIAVGDLAHMARREAFFWSREDAQQAAARFARHPFSEGLPVRNRGSDRYALKFFYLERPNPSSFRNGPYKVLQDDPAFWNALRVTPVPSVPFPQSGRWIFMNGPVLPRNDRLFVVRPGDDIAKDLVFYGAVPETLFVGIRTGLYPAAVVARSGRHAARTALGNESQQWLTLRPARAMTQRGAGPSGQDVTIVPLRISARMGTVWVWVMSEETELANFRAFGANDRAAWQSVAELWKTPDLAARLAETRYVTREAVPPLRLAQTPTATMPDGIPLAAGSYRLTGRVACRSPCVVTLDVACAIAPPRSECPSREAWHARQSWAIEPGITDLEFRFSKPFAPFHVQVWAASSSASAGCELLDWSLTPDAPALHAQALTTLDQEMLPPWFIPSPSSNASERIVPADVRFDDSLVLEAFSFPEQLVRGDTLQCGLRFVVRRPRNDLPALVSVISLTDSNWRVLAEFSMPLIWSALGPGPMTPIRHRVDAAAPEGAWRVHLAIRNVRTTRWLDCSGPNVQKLQDGRIGADLCPVRVGE